MAVAQTRVVESPRSRRPFRKRRRLITVIGSMAREIDRLQDDNLQLRAAASLYSEAIRRLTERRYVTP